MSLKGVDEGLKRKLEAVYPNVVFGPLSKVLELSATDTDNLAYHDGELKVTNPDDAQVTPGKVYNELATLGVPSIYEGESEDRTVNMVVKFPMIAFDRVNTEFALEWSGNDPMIRRGRFYVDEGARERTFPCTPTYQIDLISDRREEVDELWRQLIFFLYTQPNVAVIYHRDGKEIEENFPIELVGTDTTTDVDAFPDRGVIYRQTITIEVRQVKMLYDSETHLIETIPLRVIPSIKNPFSEEE